MSNDTENQKDSGMSGAGSSLPAAAAALSAEDRVGLVNDLKNKLENLALEDTDFMGTLSPKVRKRVEALKELQSQHNGVETKFFEELAALEAKYQKLYEPHYEKRYEIVNGVVEVEGIGEEDKGTDIGVPEFWLQAMKNHELLAEEITERDEQALKYLKDIKWYKSDDPKGFKLEFFFDPNPFFKNTILTKTYQITVGVDPILEKAIGTNIEWHPGKCLTKKILKKKPKKGSKNAKPITKIEDCESFFNFFNPPKAPGDRDDIDEDEAEELMNILEEDYDIGSIIREKIIPRAVSWYTGEAEAVEEDGSSEEDDLNEEDNKAKEVNSLRN